MVVHMADFTIYTGTTFEVDLISRWEAGGPARNLTGYTVMSSLFHPKLGTHKLMVVPDLANGKVTIGAPASVTAKWLPGIYTWSVMYIAPNGLHDVKPDGKQYTVEVERGATHP